MNELEQLIEAIKKQLKLQGITYRDLAGKLALSEPSVKRLMATNRMTINRLTDIANVLGFTLSELMKVAINDRPRISHLTQDQEQQIIGNLKLLIVTVCALNHWTMDEILYYYSIGKPECISLLLKLDALRIIDLLPNNRIRTIVARDFDWIPSGPINQYFRTHGMPDFLDSPFTDKGQNMFFIHGMFTDQAISQIQTELRQLQAKFSQLHEESLSAPLSKRKGCGALLALRAWEPNEFKDLRRNK